MSFDRDTVISKLSAKARLEQFLADSIVERNLADREAAAEQRIRAQAFHDAVLLLKEIK